MPHDNSELGRYFRKRFGGTPSACALQVPVSHLELTYVRHSPLAVKVHLHIKVHRVLPLGLQAFSLVKATQPTWTRHNAYP